MSLLAIKGAKAGQEKPHQPSIAKDDVASISKVKILYALSEGEVKGLVDGAASIMLDGTPLLDADGNPNFENVEWEIRHGTVDQTHIAGLPSLSSEIGIGTILRSGTPWIRTITNTQLSSANVNVSWSRLSDTTDKNDIIGTKVDYAIDVQTDGNGYVTVLDTSIKAKTSGRYQRTHNIKLPEAQQGWQIRVRKITADGDNERKFNQMQIDSIAEIIDAKLRYPHTALLYLSFDARAFSNIPKMTVDMYGRYLKVPVNYDPVSRTSAGIWTGELKTDYTNNPAWVYYDLITNDRYGLGDRLKPFMINKWAIAHIARICDEPVSDGKGGTEPRFTCNLYLQVDEQAYQVLQHIAAIFRGMSFWNGAQIILDADTPRDVDYVITRANVVDGAFIKSGTAIDDRHTVAQVAWSNPENNYETDYVMVRNERAIAKYGINPLEMPVVGCTSEGQAYRAGLAALLSEQNRTQTVTFTMGLDGSLPTVGDRVDIADMMFTGVNNGGRISAVNANRTVITIDRDDVPATTGDRLSVNLESGRAQTREILSVSGRNITVKTPFDPVAAENVWAVDSDELPTMSFIVLSITENEDRTQYTYTALQYDAGLYAQIDNGTIIEPRPPAPPFNPYIIQAPDSVTVSSRNRVVQAQNVTTFVIVWSQVKDAVAYDVEWRKDDGDWIKLPRTGNISAEIDGVYSGNYLARVRAVSAFDAISKPTTSMLTAITGKAGKPPKLLSIKATGLLFGMRIDWMFAPGSDDTAYTEIQVASAPDVNVATLGQFAYSTDTHTINGLQGGLTQHYRGRIVDKLGNTSDWTTWVSATTDQSADKVLDLIQGQITGSSLDQALTSQIDKIAVNETAIIAANKAIAAETQARIDAILAANDAITAERDARIADVLDANNKITAEQQARTAGLLAANEGISTEVTQRKDADTAINSRVDTLVSKTDGNTAAISSEVTARTNADTALSSRIDTVVAQSDGNTAAISSEVTARTNADSALSTRIDTVTAESAGNKTAIQTETTARTSADEALGKRIDTVTASSGENKSAIQTEVTARTNADTALSSRIDTVVAQSDGNTAAISSEVTARTNADSALSTRIDTVSSKTDDNTASITSNYETLTTATTANATKIDGVFAQVNPLMAGDDTVSAGDDTVLVGVWSETSARIEDDIALGQRIDILNASFNDNTALISTEQKVRADADSALSTRVDMLSAATEGNTASITSEKTARTTADEALGTRIDTVTATVSDNTALIQSESTARANADTALSQRVDTVQSSTATAQSKADKAEADAATAQTAANAAATAAGNKGEVIFGSTTPAAIKQLAQNLWIDTTGGKNTPKRWDGSAWSIVTDKAATDAQAAANAAQGTATEALGKANTATSNIATIQTELTATTSKTNATATSVGTLQTTVAGNTASIQTAQSTINGMQAQYTVKLDAGGRVSGFGLMNDGATSAFDVRADRFSISAPVGKPNDVNGTSPFMVLTNPQVIDGVTVPAGVYARNFYAPRASIDTIQIKDGAIKTAQIDNLAVTTAKIDNLAVKSAQIDNLAVTSGKIANLAVDTLQIAGNAITVTGVFFAEPETHFNIAQTDYIVAELDIDSAGGTVIVDYAYTSMRVYRYGAPPTLVLKILRNDVLLKEREYTLNSGGTTTFPQYMFLPIVDSPPKGINKYTVVLYIKNTKESDIRVSITDRCLIVRGAKDDRK
nr:phage tail protein [uncultured Psychrobacter sp.]